MNERFQMQGGKNWIFPKEMNATGSTGTLIGRKSCQITFVPLCDRMEGARLWTPFMSYRLCVWSRMSLSQRLVLIDTARDATIADAP
jgi:hypothetical protein